ncbi:MAG TPA: hypothetical protein VM785_09415 [Gaiellales bacterium]|nr:hypothetical protein [Gaiellales bacterium]
MAAAVALAAAALPGAASAATGWRVVHDVTTASGRHLWTQQTVDGLPVYGAHTYSNGGLGFETAVQRTFARPATAQVPGFGATEQGGSMGEGFGDYWAADQTAAASDGQGLLCLAEWDSTSYAPVPSCLRRLDSAKHFPEDMDGEVHDDGEMWSASLWLIRSAVGRTVANTDILESYFLLTPVSKFRAGTKAIIAADTSLYGGTHVAKITRIFERRGIL